MSVTPTGAKPYYYVPQPSYWPITGSCALLLMAVGAAAWFNAYAMGPWLVLAGFAVLLTMMFGWFGTVIGESEHRLYNKKVDLSFRWGMSWFIFSEVMFFAAFFGALFYVRNISVPDLGELGQKLLWPDYTSGWPTNGPYLKELFTPMEAIGIPLLNTIILVSSGGTVTVAHHALKMGHRGALKLRVRPCLQRTEPEAVDGGLRLDVLHVDRLPRFPRDDRRDHAVGNARPSVPRPFRRRAPFRVRGRSVVLALRRRRVVASVHTRVLALTSNAVRSRRSSRACS